jgi:hypothetical protein
VTDRTELLLDDIRGGPAALERLIARLATAMPASRRFAFAGMGSSGYAALLATSHLCAAGESAWVEYGSTGTPAAPAADLMDRERGLGGVADQPRVERNRNTGTAAA